MKLKRRNKLLFPDLEELVRRYRELTIEEDVEELLAIGIEADSLSGTDVGIYPSEELTELILKELKGQLGGDFSDEFDPTIQAAIDKINSCLPPGSLDSDEEI